MLEENWKAYYDKTKEKPPRTLLIEAMNSVVNKDEALDLGSGAMNDVRYLVSVGFKHVTAVDKEPVANEIIDNFLKNIKIKKSYLYSYHG